MLRTLADEEAESGGFRFRKPHLFLALVVGFVMLPVGPQGLPGTGPPPQEHRGSRCLGRGHGDRLLIHQVLDLRPVGGIVFAFCLVIIIGYFIDSRRAPKSLERA